MILNTMFQLIIFLPRCSLKERKKMTWNRKIRWSYWKICLKIRYSCLKICLKIRCSFWNWSHCCMTLNRCCWFLLMNGSSNYLAWSMKNFRSWILNWSSYRYCYCCHSMNLYGSCCCSWVYRWYLAYCSLVYSSFLRNCYPVLLKKSFRWNCYLNNYSCLYYFLLL